MSVIFEQGGTGTPFGTELATRTARQPARSLRQEARGNRHGACDKKRAATGTELATLTPQGIRPTARTQAANPAAGAQTPVMGVLRVAKAGCRACSKLKYIYHTYREEKNEF